MRLRVLQCRDDHNAKLRQINLSRVPYDFVIHPVIHMPQKITHSSQTTPVVIGAQLFCIRTQQLGRLCNDQKFALHSGLRSPVRQVGVVGHCAQKFANMVDAFQDVLQ